MKTSAVNVRYVTLKKDSSQKTIVGLLTSEITVNGSGYNYQEFWLDGHRTDLRAGIVEVELDAWNRNQIKQIRNSEK